MTVYSNPAKTCFRGKFFGATRKIVLVLVLPSLDDEEEDEDECSRNLAVTRTHLVAAEGRAMGHPVVVHTRDRFRAHERGRFAAQNYFAMAFALIVEFLNMRLRKTSPPTLEGSY